MEIVRYAGLMENDFTDGCGVCVSLWTQGCPHQCSECHNPQTWDFDGGYEVPADLRGQIIKAISANGITRNFSILGGEPLCEQNLDFVLYTISAVRTAYPDIKIYIWSGYTFEELKEQKNEKIFQILSQANYLIDGRYEKELRDTTLFLRGSSNQNIIELDKEEIL